MKKALTIGLLLAAVTNTFAVIGTWTRKAGLPVKRVSHVGFSIKGKGYICGGMDAGGTDCKDLWQYNPSTNTWTQKADMPGQARRELSVFVVDTFAYVGHGRNVISSDIFFSFNRYDACTNTWSAIADCPVQRYTSTGFSIDSLGYVGCGILPGVARYKDFYEYNPRTDKWRQVAGLPSNALNRSYAGIAVVKHKAYLMGGFEGQHMADFYEFDPVANTWTQKANYPGGKRNSVSAFGLGDYVVMGIGRDSSMNSFHDFYFYNPGNGQWTRMQDYPAYNTAGAGNFVINNTAYVAGGTLRTSVANAVDTVYALTAPELTSIARQTNIKYKIYKQLSYPTLVFEATVSGALTYTIYDLSGKCVLNGTAPDFNGSYSISTSDLSHGIYTVVANLNGGTQTVKFMN